LEKGVGDVDGEACERAWAYLGKFYHIVREMKSTTRRHLLDDAFHNLWRKSFNRITALKAKLAKTQMDLAHLREKISGKLEVQTKILSF
jgi:hypothetical protein